MAPAPLDDGGSPARVEVSVVVPARQAAATLSRTLRALARSDFAGVSEVVVVDDASTDATGALAGAAGARVVRLERQAGPAAARNAGVAAARGALVAFTDADCEPTPGWLGAVVCGLGSADLVTGPVRPDPAVPVGPYDRTLSIAGASPLFETANLAVRRAVIERAGGFEAFTPGDGRPGLRPRLEQGHFGEDAVFGWRARRAGARIAFLPDAVVHHAVFPRAPRGFIAEKWRLRFFPALVRELPELRHSLFLRIFLSRRTACFDLAVAGVCGARLARRPGLALVALPYASRCLVGQDPWRRSVARHNLVLVSADAIGLAALLRGSVAARRLLL